MSDGGAKFRTHDRCRLCGGESLVPVIDLGLHSLHGQFAEASAPEPSPIPLSVVRCGDPLCGLVQSQFTAEPTDHFTSYWYRSGVSATMRTHLRSVAEEACTMLTGRKGAPPVAPRILDIGGNDGWTLDCIPAATGQRVLVDPSDVPVEHPGITKVTGFFPDGFLLTQKYDLVLSLACFYSVNDPVRFAKAVKQILAPDGLWCVEVAHLSDVLRNVDLGYWCHEHCALYGVHTLTEIARRAGLKLVRVEESAVNGGSIRCYLTHQYSTAYPFTADRSARLGALWSHGRALAQDGDACERFAKAGKELISGLRRAVHAEVGGGGRVHVMAASTKSGVVLQAAGLRWPLVEAASDRDPRKVGRKMPGLCGLPIVSEEQSRSLQPTLYVCLMPASFHSEIIARERSAGTTADILFVMPEVRRVRLADGTTPTARAA